MKCLQQRVTPAWLITTEVKPIVGSGWNGLMATTGTPATMIVGAFNARERTLIPTLSEISIAFSLKPRQLQLISHSH